PESGVRRSGHSSRQTSGRSRGETNPGRRAAALPPLQREAPAVGLDDLSGEREAQAGPGLLGGEEELQRPRDRFVGQAGTAIEDGDVDASWNTLYTQLDLVARASRLDRVLQEIHQDLLELRFVEPARLARQAACQPERVERIERAKERRPFHRTRPRRRQPREPRIAI